MAHSQPVAANKRKIHKDKNVQGKNTQEEYNNVTK